MKKLTDKDKQLLELLDFKLIVTKIDHEIDYLQYVKHFKHPFIHDLYITVDDNIYIWCSEDEKGLSGGSVLLSKRNWSQKNLLELILLLP